MDRIKSRLALLLGTAALVGAFMAPPAAAADSCYPYPEQYCNTMEWYRRCVVMAIHGYNDPWCQA